MSEKLKPIAKRDLAQMYYPESFDPSQCFRKSLQKKGIIERLEKESNFNKYDRSFTVKQLLIIYDELGMPFISEEKITA